LFLFLPFFVCTQFKEFIARPGGSERTEIPAIVTNELLKQCILHRLDPVRDWKLITYTRVRDFLQKTGYAHFFENIAQIISILTHRPPKRFTSQQKAKLTQIFKEIQEPFERHKGVRKNFLSYSYTTFKSCELLGYDDFLPLLPLLKPHNLLKADAIWRDICADCKYEFVQTL